VFELHDRGRFEVTAFSLGPDTQDAMRKRLERGFDRFIDVRERSDEQIAALARELKIDIAVDLGGFTSGARPGIFARRAAPLQVSYLGYLGTLGAPYMDYLIADPVLVPPEAQRHYCEKLLYLPSYQANDSQRRSAERPFSREELGLPSAGFVYCCFNGSYKLTPETFSGWMRILAQTPDSVLFLYADNATAEGNLRREAQRRGIDGRRLVFGGNLPMPEYLARYAAADLFLDTLPYNAGTTASDALWAGLPVLTRLGETFAGRVAGSVLTAAGLPELVATSQEDYERLAVDLARDRQRLAGLRRKLAEQRPRAALFDTPRFVANLETGYRHIQQRRLAGLPNEHVWVSAS
jgi:predicted O-linked N-acetylglucosamine transferase (SPINDLY family)